MGWALSCLQWQKIYNKVTLYADDIAAKLLIDTLRLPNTTVICELGKLNSCHPSLWALPKIYAYSKQESPFLHVDGDVFIWHRFNETLLQGGLIAQNKQVSTDCYEGVMSSLESSQAIDIIQFCHKVGHDRTVEGCKHSGDVELDDLGLQVRWAL